MPFIVWPFFSTSSPACATVVIVNPAAKAANANVFRNAFIMSPCLSVAPIAFVFAIAVFLPPLYPIDPKGYMHLESMKINLHYCPIGPASVSCRYDIHRSLR